MNMKLYNKLILSLTLGSMVMFGCSDDFLNINENPNLASEGVPELLLTSAQANIGAEFASDLGFSGSVYARQNYALGTSTYAMTGATFQSDWNSLYSGGLKDLAQLRTIGEETGNEAYVGVSKILTSYVFHQLVDYFGDVPYREALQGETILSPAFDSGASIYDDLLVTLDEAIVNLDSAASQEDFLNGDIMYGGDYGSWIEVANTLKLKLYMNLSNIDPSRAASGINAILADGRIIDAVSEDFQLEFTDSQVPRGRHIWYDDEYDTSPGYLDNFFMYTMLDSNDPRLRFYVYRQAGYDDLDFQTSPCSGRTDCNYWPLLLATGENYIGREHGDPSGLPGDDNLVTVVGLYPAGGKFDDDSYRTVNQNSSNAANRGAEGAGLMPLLTSSMTHFMLAEAMLNIPGVTAPLSAEGHFEAGMRDSFDKVRDFAMSSIESENITDWETDNLDLDNGVDYDSLVDRFVVARMADFQNGSDFDKLNILMLQKAVASWGNGMEPYTDLRRTDFSGYPAALAPQGPFPLRVLLPDSELSGNANAPSTRPTAATPVFWDN